MTELSKMQVGTTTYNIKDAVARESLTAATATKAGLMSANDKKKVDSTLPPIILTMGSEDNTDNNEDFKSFATSANLSLINQAINEGNPCVFVKGYDIDGYFLSHVTINTDGRDIFVRVHGNPYRWDTEKDCTNIIAVDYYIYNDMFESYRLITASVGDAVQIN